MSVMYKMKEKMKRFRENAISLANQRLQEKEAELRAVQLQSEQVRDERDFFFKAKEEEVRKAEEYKSYYMQLTNKITTTLNQISKEPSPLNIKQNSRNVAKQIIHFSSNVTRTTKNSKTKLTDKELRYPICETYQRLLDKTEELHQTRVELTQMIKERESCLLAIEKAKNRKRKYRKLIQLIKECLDKILMPSPRVSSKDTTDSFSISITSAAAFDPASASPTSSTSFTPSPLTTSTPPSSPSTPSTDSRSRPYGKVRPLSVGFRNKSAPPKINCIEKENKKSEEKYDDSISPPTTDKATGSSPPLLDDKIPPSNRILSFTVLEPITKCGTKAQKDRKRKKKSKSHSLFRSSFSNPLASMKETIKSHVDLWQKYMERGKETLIKSHYLNASTLPDQPRQEPLPQQPRNLQSSKLHRQQWPRLITM